MAAAGTALFRSMATKMAPALRPRPQHHRVTAARGLHSGTSNPAAQDKEVVRQVIVRDHSADSDPGFMKETMDQIKATTNTCIAVFVFGGGLFCTFVKPKLEKLEDRADTLSREVFKLKEEITELKNIKDEGHKTEVYEAQSMETSGPKSTS